MTMATTSLSMTSREVNGSAMAALLGGGIGAFAMGAVVLLNEAGIFAAPTLYAPAGGVSGRTTLATIVWLMAWAQACRQASCVTHEWIRCLNSR
jgi:hypothetical protein